MNRRTVLKGTALSLAVIATTGVAASARSRFAPLTVREAQVSELIAAGLTNTEIARHFGRSKRTIDVRVSMILEKLDLHTRAQIGQWVSRTRPL